jgi:3-oxoacyl-[acyl-carrier protein] reductase
VNHETSEVSVSASHFIRKTNPVALVTGGTGLLGSEITRRLAGAGWSVAIHYGHDEAKALALQDACKPCAGLITTIQADLTSDQDCRTALAHVEQRHGHLDALINCAAKTKFVSHAQLDGLTMDDFQSIYALNVVAPFQLTRAALPLLEHSDNASVTNVSSLSGIMGTGTSISYAASKGALNTLTLSLARTLAPRIRVNAVCPALIESDWLPNAMGAERYQRFREAAIARIPLGRPALPEEIADTVVWLAASATYVTGTLLTVDGGARLGPRM